MKSKCRNTHSVLTELFGDQKSVMQLYQLLHPEEIVNQENKIHGLLLENIMSNPLYNGLVIFAENRLMIFLEVKDSWDNNTSLKSLLSLSRNFKRYAYECSSLDKNLSINLFCFPELYLIYTNKNSNLQNSLNNSNDFPEYPFISQNDFKTSIQIIYNSKPSEKLLKYIMFCKVFNEQMKLFVNDKDSSAKRTLEICNNMELLEEFTKKHREEIYNIMYDLVFNMDYLQRFQKLK